MPDTNNPVSGNPAQPQPSAITKSEHAKLRSAQGRPISEVASDLQRAGPRDVFVQEEDSRFVVRGPKGREHILEANGEHVTSIRAQTRLIRPGYETARLDKLQRKSTRRPNRSFNEETMQDDEIMLCNACTDLVTLKSQEAFPRELLTTKRPGEWVGVREYCTQIGLSPTDLTSRLFAAWLPDPTMDEEYALILFYDDESKWSMAAQYNRAEFQRSIQPTHRFIQRIGLPGRRQAFHSVRLRKK